MAQNIITTSHSSIDLAYKINRAIKGSQYETLKPLLNDSNITAGILNTIYPDNTTPLYNFVNKRSINAIVILEYQNCLKILLEGGADPNKKIFKEKTIFQVAAEIGNDVALKVMLQFAVMARKDGTRPSLLKYFIDCRKKILESGRVIDETMDKIDGAFLSALEFAAKHGTEDIVIYLLKYGVNLGEKNAKYCLRSVKANTFEKFLDDCISDNKEKQHDAEYLLILKYKFLTPRSLRKNPNSKILATEMAPLRHISENVHLRDFLKHPVIESFLHLKWYRVQAMVYTNLVFYSVFLILLNIHILTEHFGDNTIGINPTKNGQNFTLASSEQSENHTNRSSEKYLNPKLNDAKLFYVWILFTSFLAIFLARELVEVLISPINYFKSAENYLEICLIALIGMNYCNYYNNIQLKNEISALTIFLSWLEFIIMTGRLPVFSISFEMMRVVSKNLLKIMIYYSLFIIAFSLCFYIVFHDDFILSEVDSNIVVNIISSLIKTVVMTSGEFEFGDSINMSVVPVMSRVLFVGFVLFISIVLLNLLNGMAVGDTRDVRKKAEVLSLVSRVKLLSAVEHVLTGTYNPILKKSWIKYFYLELMLFSTLPLRYVKIDPNKHQRIVYDNDKNYIKSRFSSRYCFRNVFDGIKMTSGIVQRAMKIQRCKKKTNVDENSQMEQLRNEVQQLKSVVFQMSEKLDDTLLRFNQLVQAEHS